MHNWREHSQSLKTVITTKNCDGVEERPTNNQHFQIIGSMASTLEAVNSILLLCPSPMARDRYQNIWDARAGPNFGLRSVTRELRGAQKGLSSHPARSPPDLGVSPHDDLVFVAQRRRGLLRKADALAAQAIASSILSSIFRRPSIGASPSIPSRSPIRPSQTTSSPPETEGSKPWSHSTRYIARPCPR